MLELEQRQLSGGSADTSADRVLAIHARLGRCRKAFSELEVEIQWSEQNRRADLSPYLQSARTAL